MARELLMGNTAIGLGAIKAGVNLVSGYPGTPDVYKRQRHNIEKEIDFSHLHAAQAGAQQ